MLKTKKIFAALENSHDNTPWLFCKLKYAEEASIFVSLLSTYIYYKYGKDILLLFDAETQHLIFTTTWYNNSFSIYKYEREVKNAIKDSEVDWLLANTNKYS